MIAPSIIIALIVYVLTVALLKSITGLSGGNEFLEGETQMKRALSLLVVGVLLLAIGVGTWVDACTPKRVYDARRSQMLGRPVYTVIEPSGEGAGLGAGIAVFACAMVAGGIVMIIKREKTES